MSERISRPGQGLTLDELSLGQVYERKFQVTEQMIEKFAEASGDVNPIHLDEEYARKSIFKTRVAHGMLLAGFISAVLGCEFPGAGTIYLGQTLKFLRPTLIGDEITVKVTIQEMMKEKNRARLETVCFNQRGETVLTGEASVMLPT
ncbi:MAG: MaoC family dehydratase [Thermodesulfobacteriota bacterium]